MPKEKKHLVEIQKQRKKIKEKPVNYVPGIISLQVLGTGAKGAPKSLYVFTDQSRYLFNCGEGTQRLAHEHKMKLTKLEHIFITEKSWMNIGGLPGIALTVQDVGVPQITLHGPRGLEELFLATKRFVILRDLEIKMADCKKNQTFQDNVLRVSYVPIFKTSDSAKPENSDSKPESTTGKEINEKSKEIINYSASQMCIEVIEEDKVDYYAHERKAPVYNFKYCRSRTISASGRRNLSNRPADLTHHNYLNELKNEHTVMCYICKIHPRPGALNLHKCVEKGIKSGPLFGKLKNGEDVTLPSGVVIKSSDVCEPGDPGPTFLVVDCPSEDYLESFTTNPSFQKYQQGAEEKDDEAYLVVHFTPLHIMNTDKYKLWMNAFPSTTQHLILNENNTCMGSAAVHRVQYKLNMLHSGIFPLLGDKGSQTVNDTNYEEHTLKKLKTETITINITKPIDDKSECFYANTFLNFHLRPRKGIDRTTELILKPSEYLDECNKVEGFAQELALLKKNIIERMKNVKVRTKNYPRFLFLGTGSCIPNKTRNTSGILYEVSDHTIILLDCGEGTFGQIVRFYGPEKADEILYKIKGIFISHLHADHHIGLIGLLQGRQNAMKRLNKLNLIPLLLLAPKQILTWLNFYNNYFEAICDQFDLVANDELLYQEHTLFEGTRERVLLTLEMFDINTALVRHCPNAFGIAFRHRSGHKICYSGDTMPSENLINIGQNCDLLIHEATMEDELDYEAVAKMHSTTSQAIEVGTNMNAHHILLTHFSQRYAKIPLFNENFGNNVGIAFDNMQVWLEELPLVPLFYPALKLMFAEHYEELENKAFKRQLRQEMAQCLQGSSESASQSRSSEVMVAPKMETR